MKVISIFYNDRRVFWILFGMVVIFSIGYIYLVQYTVLNVVKKEKLVEEISTLQARLSVLESSQIALEKTISLNFAYSQGFKEVADAQFIERKSLGKGLSVNTLP